MTKAISNIIINEIEKVGNYIGNKMESVSSRLDKTRGELMQEIYKIKRDLERLKQNKKSTKQNTFGTNPLQAYKCKFESA